MESHHLLYVDILGFAELTKKNPAKVEQIFRVITEVKKHKNSHFEILIFSDTILVRNKGTPDTIDYQMYCVQWLFEFAVDLQYRLCQLDVFFRAVLIYGPFNSYKLEGVDCFYGEALIDAYTKEKKINCVGLFLDKSSYKFHGGFPTIQHDENLLFAYTCTSFDEHAKYSGSKVVIEKFILEETEECFLLSYDVSYISRIYNMACKHPDPNVRIKFLSAFNYYEQRYPIFIRALIDNKFDIKIICQDYDWSQQNFYSEVL
jgi:hypothetical protein